MLKRLALCAAAFTFSYLFFLPGFAADLGGNCCADLEERVAELEAVSAHHGNRKMSVTIYGQVDKAWLYESNSLSGTRDQMGVIDNPNSPTMFGLVGESKLNKDVRAGFKIEIQLDGSFANGTLARPDFQNVPTIRTAVGFFDTTFGKFTIGHGSMASDKSGQITVANTEVASRLLSLGPVSTIFLGGFDLPYNDVRRDSLRFDTPSLLGFTFSGSVANGDGTPSVAAMFVTTHDAWDLAGRYAGEFGGFRLAGGISYRDEQQALVIGPAIGTRTSVTQGSVSGMYMPLGLFINLAAGHIEGDLIWGNSNNYQVQAGIEKKFFSVGATTAFGEYSWMDITRSKSLLPTSSPTMWGLGAVQSLDQLAVDLYADYKHYDTDKIFRTDITGDVFMAGARVKF